MGRIANSAAFRRRARALVGLVAALVVLTGFARAGTRYFYCPVMDEVLAQPCCGPHATGEHDADRSSAPCLTDRECCQARTLPNLPAVDSRAHGITAADVAPLAVAIAFPALVRAPYEPVRVTIAPSGIPPPPLSARDRCAVLRTFLL